VSDEHNQGPVQPQDHHDATGWIILGALLIVGGFVLGARNLGWVPWQLGAMWDSVVEARFGIGIVLLGILLIIWAQSGKRFKAPEKGSKLYRLRHDKWVAGVLGGLADYFGIDATLLRLAFIGLLVLGGASANALVVVYIVMAVVVPQEPAGSQAVPAPEWPNTPPPPPPPAATVAPAAPEVATAPPAPAAPASPPPPPVPAPGESDVPPQAPTS